MLSSHFFCLPCIHPPFSVPCKIVLARPDEWQTCLYHCNLRLFTMFKTSSCGPIACWIEVRTSSLVTWSTINIPPLKRKEKKLRPLTSGLAKVCRHPLTSGLAKVCRFRQSVDMLKSIPGCTQWIAHGVQQQYSPLARRRNFCCRCSSSC